MRALEKLLLLTAAVLLVAGAVVLTGANLGWWNSTECPAGPGVPACFQTVNPVPLYVGISLAVAGLGVAGTVLVRDPRKQRWSSKRRTRSQVVSEEGSPSSEGKEGVGTPSAESASAQEGASKE